MANNRLNNADKSADTNRKKVVTANDSTESLGNNGSEKKSVRHLVRKPLFSAEIEEALRVSNERFDQFADDSPLWIWETSSQGVCIYSNRFIEKITGYHPSEVVLKRTIDDILNPKTEDSLMKLRTVFNSEKKFSDIILTSRNKWGDELRVSVSGSPYLDLNGKFLGFRGVVSDLTESDRLTRELISTSEYYYNILESILDLIIILDENLIVRVINKVTANALKNAGLKSEIIGMDVKTALPFITDEAIADFKRILSTGVPETTDVHYRYQGLRLDGESRRVPILRGGKTIGLLLAVHDLAARMNIEEELRKSNERFKDVTEIVGGWIWETNDKGVITYASAGVEKVLGYLPKEIMGRHYIYDFLDPSSDGRIKGALLDAFSKRVPYYSFAIPSILKSGAKATLEISGIPYFDANKVFLGYRGMSTNITEYQIYEENLKKFELAVENASDLIIITDSEGIILYANKASSTITGFDKKEIIGHRPSIWGNLMPKEFYQSMWDTIKNQKKIFISEISNRRKDGRAYIADLRITPILDHFGEIKFFVGIERDITKAKEVDRAKTEFVSLASHQLRSPLTIIRWYAEALISKPDNLDEKQIRYLKEILTGDMRMIDLVEALLNVSRIEMHGLSVNVESTDFRALIQNALQNYDLQIKLKKLKISYEPPTVIPILNLDRKLMGIVVENLLSNAIKYTPEGGGISLSLSLQDNSLAFSISDTGFGIPKDQQSKIFTKFFRGDNAQKTDPNGNGLGLYITKSIVDIAHGRIWFESEEGKGTTFYVALPLIGMTPKEEGGTLIS